jgi:hypothetical protein
MHIEMRFLVEFPSGALIFSPMFDIGSSAMAFLPPL